MASKPSEELTRSDRAMLIVSLVSIAVGIICVVVFGVLNPGDSPAGWTSRIFPPGPKLSEPMRFVRSTVGIACAMFLMFTLRPSLLGIILLSLVGSSLVEGLFFLFRTKPDWLNFGLCLVFLGLALLLFVPIHRLHRARCAAQAAVTVPGAGTAHEA